MIRFKVFTATYEYEPVGVPFEDDIESLQELLFYARINDSIAIKQLSSGEFKLIVVKKRGE